MIPMQKERRQALRYPTELEIDVILADGTLLSVTTHDISVNSLQFKCDIEIANEIEPRGLQNHSMDRQQFKIVAKLPIETKPKLYASCAVTAARRLSQEEYILSIEFVDFENSSEKVLLDYIKQLHQEVASPQ